MRFDKINYLHTDVFDDIKEIKFATNFEENKEVLTTVEIWLQDGNANVVLVNNETNDIEYTTNEEREFVLNFADKHGLIHLS